MRCIARQGVGWAMSHFSVNSFLSTNPDCNVKKPRISPD
jgi:hypothetical protein